MVLIGMATSFLALVHLSKPPSTNISFLDVPVLEPEELELEATRARLHKAASNQDMQRKESALIPHQFLHLHHMKTGGTSVDHLLSCARRRLEASWSKNRSTTTRIPYYSLHECSARNYTACLNNSSDYCRGKLNHSSVLSYCAPLFHLPKLGWDMDAVSSLTVLRHPVDRVWSMYRFTTLKCYHCQNLTSIYEKIDSGNTKGLDPLCLAQLGNHQVTNLLTSPELYRNATSSSSDNERLQQAIANLKTQFTMVGLTEDMNRTHRLIGHVFPWLAEDYQGSPCPMKHDNASPKNNHCAPGNQHWDLPPHPDEATRRAIEKHNQLDMKLYEAAVQHFELQLQAVGL